MLITGKLNNKVVIYLIVDVKILQSFLAYLAVKVVLFSNTYRFLTYHFNDHFFLINLG